MAESRKVPLNTITLPPITIPPSDLDQTNLLRQLMVSAFGKQHSVGIVLNLCMNRSKLISTSNTKWASIRK